jgi:hypothetical protein
MILPIALYTTTISPTGKHVCDGWLPAGTEIESIDATDGGSDIIVTITVGGGLAPEQIRMTPAELETFAAQMASGDAATAGKLNAAAHLGRTR